MTDEQMAADVQRAAAGDPEALQRVVVRCHTPLLAAVLSATDDALRSRIDPDDVLQQAYIAAFKTLANPTPNPSPQREQGPRPPSRDRQGATSPDPQRERGADDPTRDRQGATNPPHFDNPGHFYKWLEQIALNRLRDAQRALRRQKRDIAREAPQRPTSTDSYPDLIQRLAATDPTPSRHIAKDEAVAAVMTCLARLGDDQREVIRLRFLQGVPFAEIAKRMGKSDEAIHMSCHRALKNLRGMMVSITRYLTKL